MDTTSIQYKTILRFNASEIVASPELLWSAIPDSNIRGLVLDKVIVHALKMCIMCQLVLVWFVPLHRYGQQIRKSLKMKRYVKVSS